MILRVSSVKEVGVLLPAGPVIKNLIKETKTMRLSFRLTTEAAYQGSLGTINNIGVTLTSMQ